MSISIKTNKTTYQFEIGAVNQWCGENIILKNQIVDIISKYFSKSKYAEYEENMVCDVFIDNESVGRNYYNTFLISSREEMISNMKLSKNSLVMKYLMNRIMTNFDVSREMFQIEDQLTNVFRIINEEIFDEFENLGIDFEQSELFEIIQESKIVDANGENINRLSNYEILSNYIKLVCKVGQESGNQILVIIRNVDHLLTSDEYRKIYDEMLEMTRSMDIKFIVTISLDGYCIINKSNIENVTIINDEEYTLPPFGKIKEYIENNYPIYREIDDDWLVYNLEKSVNIIGKSDGNAELSSEIVAGLINRTLHIIQKQKYPINNIELAFINKQ